MLQQTTVGAVIPYFERWLSRFPDVRTLASSSLRDVLRAWQGLGYYARARNLHEAARQVLRDHGGRVPDDEEALRRLPGLGAYTTPAILSFAYDRPVPVIEANIRRVLMRIFGWEREISAANDRKLLAELRSFFPAGRSAAFNQAMMELGELVCRNKSPQCLLCPVSEYCRAAQAGRQEVIPSRRKRAKTKIEAVVAVIQQGNRYLLQKRTSSGLLSGLWEFPGGKRSSGEGLEEALRREVREEVGADIREVTYLTSVTHAYTRFQVRLHAFSCRLANKPVLSAATHRWLSLTTIRRYPLPSGSVKIVKFLADRGRTKPT